MENGRDAKALHCIEEMTRNAGQVQEMILAEILQQNAQTEYLKRFNLGGATDVGTFKSKVPCITYEDIRPEIKRIANGDRSAILTAIPVSEFFISSGTTSGEPKPIPMTEEEFDRRQVLNTFLIPVMNRYVPDLNKGKGLYFYFVNPETRTPAGHVTRNVLTKYYKSKHYRNQRLDPFTQHTSPTEAIFCTEYFQSTYAQMLCGLYASEQVNRIGAAFASGLLRIIRFLELNWQDLIHDIKTGSLNPKITDGPIRESLNQILKPDSEIADLVSKACSSNNWEGIIPRIWPNAKYLDVTATGAMAQYAPMLDYYSGGLPIASTIYACSECCFGINLNPMSRPGDVTYTIMPNLAYFEFIPQEQHSSDANINSNPELINLVDVEVGKEYEIVITTYAGLYRYQVGDILRCTGFHNSAPEFKFLRRKNVVLSIDADKTDESELQRAVNNASGILQQSKIGLVDYTSQASTKEIPGHYVIYMELMVKESENSLSDEVMSQCCITIENSFNFLYRKCRGNKSIGPLEIRVLKNGTFQELMEQAVSRGASVSQYKVPRCVKTAPALELLEARVVSSHFSPCLPSQEISLH